METDFIDIQIVGLEEEMTVESPEDPRLQYIYLRLSRTPLPIWQSYFKEARHLSRHPHWRRAWIDRKYIVVECVPEEIEKYHLDDLKQDLAKANRRCRDYLHRQTHAERHKASAEEQVRERLREIKNRLKFD